MSNFDDWAQIMRPGYKQTDDSVPLRMLRLCWAAATEKAHSMTPKESTPRVASLRAARKASGLKRLELYVHPDDEPQIRALAERLKKKREKLK